MGTFDNPDEKQIRGGVAGLLNDVLASDVAVTVSGGGAGGGGGGDGRRLADSQTTVAVDVDVGDDASKAASVQAALAAVSKLELAAAVGATSIESITPPTIEVRSAGGDSDGLSDGAIAWIVGIAALIGVFCLSLAVVKRAAIRKRLGRSTNYNYTNSDEAQLPLSELYDAALRDPSQSDNGAIQLTGSSKI